MAIVQLVTSGQHIIDSPNFTASDRWDGYACSIGKDFPEGPFQGYQLDWGGFDSQETFNPFFNQPYQGYTTNWGQADIQGAINSFDNVPYQGYTTNWGQYSAQPIQASIEDVDQNTLIDYPKDQIIYYKLKGYNPSTQQYESWIVSHNVTGRPALDGGLFDPTPGYEPPNEERDVFKTPPSGNTLVNIMIIARWME